MPIPSVSFNQLDNQVGVVSLDGDTVAFVGWSPTGTLNQVVGYNRKSDAKAALGVCPLAHSICNAIDGSGKTVLGVRCDKTTAGAYTTVVHAGAGSSVVTTDPAVEPYDDCEVIWRVIAPGTIGSAGITFQYSIDGGRNWGAELALGTANTYTIPEINAKLNFAAGTVLAGQTESFRTTAPVPNAAQITAALEALRATSKKWRLVVFEFPATATLLAAVSTAIAAMRLVGKEVSAIASYRIPLIAESEATYLAAYTAEFLSYADDAVVVCYGACFAQSSLDFRNYVRRWAFQVGIAASISRAGQDLAHKGNKLINPLPASIQIKDANGNAAHHDEFIDPGADAVRGSTLRSWPGEPGAFFGNLRLMSTATSDFVYLQHRRVMNLAREVARRVLSDSSSQDILVDPKTGFILEEEALAIESEVNMALDLEMVTRRECSGAEFRLNRTDNILSTFELKGALRVTPLAYAKKITVDVGFYNPALRARAPE